MCDRNKQEILARELCIIEWQAWSQGHYKQSDFEPSSFSIGPISTYVDEHWNKYATRATEILEMLDNHEA